MFADGQIVELLQLLGDEASESVLTQLGTDESEALREKLNSAPRRRISPRRQMELLDRFETFLQFAIRNGSSKPRLYTEDEPEDEPPPAPIPQKSLDKPLEALIRLNPYQLGRALENEQSRTIALLLSQFPPKLTAEVLSVLPDEARTEVVRDLSKSLPAPPVLVERIARTTLQRAATQPPVPPDRRDHIERLAEVLRSMPKTMSRKMLTAIQDEDPESAIGLMRRIYRFDDIANLEKRHIQRMLGEVDTATLTTALFQAPESVRSRIMENLARRARQTLEEEMQFQTHVPDARVIQARETIAEALGRIDMEEE